MHIPDPSTVRAIYITRRHLVHPLGLAKPGHLDGVSAYTLADGVGCTFHSFIPASAWTRLVEGAGSTCEIAEYPDLSPAWTRS